MVEENKGEGKPPAIKSALKSKFGTPKMSKSVSYGEVRESLTPVTEHESENT